MIKIKKNMKILLIKNKMNNILLKIEKFIRYWRYSI